MAKQKYGDEVFREIMAKANAANESKGSSGGYGDEVFNQIMASANAASHVKQANRFIVDVNKFSRAVEEDTSGDNQFNAADYFEERKKQAEQLKQRAAEMTLYMDDHKDSFSEDSYERMMNILSTFDTDVDDVMSRYQPSLDSKAGMRAYEDELMAAMERNAQQKQWEQASDFAFEPGSFAANMMPLMRQKLFDEGDHVVKDNWSAEQRYRLGLMQMEDPNQAKDYAKEVNAGRDPYIAYQQQEQQKADWRAMDLNAERREIDRLKAELDDYYWNSNYDATSTNARNAFDQEVKRREKEISDREQQYNLAKREQDSAQFRSAADRSDFAAKSGYVSTGFQMPNYVEDADPDELVYEYINNPEIRSQVNQQTIELAAKGYDLLNEEDEREISIYNYYYATEGPAKAQQYLDNIQDTLNQRFGERGAASKNQLWKQLMAGAISGYSNAVTSPQYFFDKESDYINTSPFQYMSAAIREDLADTGKHPFFDTSLGQMGYDLVNTTANMLPSIMLSGAATAMLPGAGAAIAAIPKLGAVGNAIAANAPQIGAAIGSATMGLSAAGGAYQQALNAGYTKEQANRYAALSGASEVALEYLLGGISKLGGEIPQAVLSNMVSGVDNAIARAAIELGGSMASEGFEEGLQEVITPWIENLTLYADKDVDWNEVAYSTLLGALSGGLMEGPAVVSNEIRSARANNLMELAKQKVEAEMATANMTAEQIEGMKPTTSADGNARLISENRPVDVVEFAEVKDGKATVKLKDGTAAYQDVSFSTDKQANQYFAVESLPVIDTAHANDLLKTIQNADVGKDTAEVVAIRESYRLGYMGATTQELRGSDAQILPTKLQDQIYNIGKEQRTANDAVRAAASTARTKATAGYKKVVIEGKLSRVTRDAAKKRKAEIEYVDRIADTFAGTAVHVYESYEKNGKRYYKDNSGKEQIAPNGKYVNDEIWLDLNSGDNGEGLMLNTFAHEMYHHIEKWNKPKARELAEFVVKELGLESVDKAVAAQIEKARAAGYGEDHFKGMSPEQARNEVYMRAMSDFVADSLETMFTRGDPAKAIANLKKENKGLFDQIKAFIDEWISKVKKFYSDKTISQEGAAVAQLEKFEQLQKLFMEAMNGAGENYRAAEVSDSNQKDVAKFQARSSFKNGLYFNIDSRRYWYPAMKKSEIAYVKSLADHEANTTDNYLGIDVKWLYNNQKGHEYFALYSTADTEGTTLLYACKNTRARYEKNYLVDLVQKEEQRNESINTDAGIVRRLLSSIKDAVSSQSAYNRNIAGTRGDNGNDATYRNNRRNRLSAAFLNCLENISKVQSRYGLDDHYLFAVERGDLKSAQRMVDEAAQMFGYTIRAWHGTPIRGITVFNEKKIGSTTDSGIFGRGFYFSTSKVTADGYAKESGETMPVFLHIKKPFWANQYHDVDVVADMLNMSKDALVLRKSGISNVVAPIMSQSGQFTAHLKELGYDSVIIQHGKHNYEVVIFDNKMIKSADAVTYDDNGNVIPISQRFNPENEDIRYSLRNQQATDSSGNMLTEAQQEYFKDSLARDENGNLLVLYHGTKKGGFTIYDPNLSKDGLFLTDRKEVARTYSGTEAEYAPKAGDPSTSGEMNYKVYANLRKPLIVDAKNAMWRKLPPLDPASTKFEYVKLLKYRNAKKSLFGKPFEIKLEVKERGKDSKVITFDNYIACMNYIGNGFKEIIPDDGKPSVGKTFFDIGGENNWNTRQYCAYAKKSGYDGVIFRNIITPGSEAVNGQRNFVNTAVVAFDSKQIKSVKNTTPTENPNFQLSLRNQQPTAREILMQTDPQTQKNNVKGHLTRYQERVVQLNEAESRREEVKAQIEALAVDSKKNRKELAQLRTENRNLTTQITGLKEKLKFSENTDMMRRIVASERLKNQPPAKSYKDEQEDFIRSMLAEHRVIRKELTGADSVMFVMEDTFVKLAKDYEAKKIDMKTMEKEFMRIMKEYEKQTEKSGKKAKADSEKIETLTAENKIWLREYQRLMKEYDLSDRKIARLEATIARQRATAKARVEGRRKTEMRHNIQRKVNELDQLLRHGTKHRNVPEFLQDSVAAVLQAINMEVRDSDQRRKTYEATIARYDRQIELATDPLVKEALIEKRDNYAAKGDQFANRMAMLQKAYEQIRKENTGLELDEGIAEHLNSLFETVGDTPLGQMTAAQLDAVNDILNVTMATVRNANEMLAEARSAGVVESSKSAIMEIKSAGETKKKKTRLRKNLEQFGWNNLKPVYAFDVIGSKTLTDRYEALRKGEDTLAVDLNEAKEFFQEQWKKNGGKEWDMEQKWQFTSTSGKSLELDLNQIMSLYALAKDNDARSHLRVGGFAFDSDYQTQKRGPLNIPIKVESTDASAYNLSDEILGEIISKLTPQQRAFADAMQAYLSDTMAAKGNEVSLKKYGIRLFKKKDYFPIRVADQFLAKAREQNAGDRKIKDSGFTKDRKPEAKNPVVLSGFTEIWAEHVDEMSLYHSFVLPLDDFNRVLNYHDAFVEGEQAASVVEAITNAFGKGAVNYIDQLIKDVNGGIKGGSTVSFANSLVSKAKKAQTMASLSVAIQQLSSIIRAMSEVDRKYFIGPRVTEKSHDRTWDEIKKHAPIAIIKEMGGYDTNVGKSTVDYLIDTADYDGFGEKFKAMFTDEKFRDDALGRLPALMDEMSWGVIWNAIKREQRDLHPNMDTKSDAFMKLVANRFTEVITRTQVYDSVFSRSGLMRDRKSDLAKMITSFMAEPTTTANMLAVSILQAKRGDIPKKQVAKTTASIVASLALNAALVSVIYAMRDDDEDKRYDEKWVENFRNNFFESLNPLGYIPYVRDVYNLFAKGYDVERADMELFGDLQNAIEGLGNEDITAWEKTENVIGAIGNLLGVPVKNILRDVKGFVQTLGFMWDDRPNPKTKTGTYMAWRGMDLNDKEQMILAIQSGDEEHLQRVFGRFENQQKAESALQSAIREKYVAGEMTAEEAEEMLTTNFDRDDEYEIYWLMEEWDYAKENGNTDGYTKYGSLYEAIETGEYEAEIARFLEHGADASTIRSQISKHYRKQYLEDETAREEIREKLLPVYEATGMYASEVEDKFNDWDFEAEYGMTYGDMKGEFRDGNVTEAELRSAMDFYGLLNYEIEDGIRELNKEIKFFNKYGMSMSEMTDAYDRGDVSRNTMIGAKVFNGMTKKEAQEWVNQRDISNSIGIDFMELDDAYKYNDISRTTLRNAILKNGETPEKTDEAMMGYDWLKKNVKKYPDLAISDAKKFAVRIHTDYAPDETLEDYGVSIDAYIEYQRLRPECKGVDANGDGKTDDGTLRDSVFRMIDSLPISSEAKDGLALMSYSAKSIRRNAPWH